MTSVRSRHGRTTAIADCPRCGWQQDDMSRDEPSYARRQAVKHATATGHTAHVTSEVIRLYGRES